MTTPTLPPTSHTPQKYAGPSAAEVLARRKQFLNPGIFLYYKEPLMLVEGKMQYAWDDTGKRYLDGLGGIVTISVGHCHPHVVAAAAKQNDTLQHSATIYLHPNVCAFAEKLASRMPGELKVLWSPHRRLRNHSWAKFTSTRLAEIRSPQPSAKRCSKSSRRKGSRKTRATWACASRTAWRSKR
jgi:hypothetical protein